MIRRARSTTASMSSVQAPVERYFQPPSGSEGDDRALVHGGRHLGRPGQDRPRRQAGEDAQLGQAPGPLDRLVEAHDEAPVEDVGVEDRRDVALVQRAEALHVLPRRGLDGHDPHAGLALLQVPADAHQRAAGAEAGHEGVDLGAVGPDLGARPLVVGLGVGGVAVLVEEDDVALLGQLLGHPDGAVAALGGRRGDDLGAEDLQQLAALDRHVLRAGPPGACSPSPGRPGPGRCRCCRSWARGWCRRAGGGRAPRRPRSSTWRCGP